MRFEKGQRGRRAAAACLAGGILAGCAELTALWSGVPRSGDMPVGLVEYPDLSLIPERPGTGNGMVREEIARTLAGDRTRAEAEGESLRREIETGFVVPAPPPGP